MTRDGAQPHEGGPRSSPQDSVALQQSAVTLIGELGRENIASYLKQRIGAVTDTAKRIALITSYSLLEKERSFDFLQQLAACAAEPSEIRAASLYWLAKATGPLAIEPVVAALTSSDQTVRIAALRSVSILPRAECIRQIKVALEGSSEELQAVAASMLLEIEAAEVVGLIERYFREHPESPDAKRALEFASKVRRESRASTVAAEDNEGLYGEY